MEARELRIGNIVYYKLEDQLTVFTIDNGKQIDSYLKVLEPIPLTEEWLLKFGFQKKEGRMFYFDEYKLALFDDGAILFSGSMFTGKIGSIKHVHQLQNLYYALTNQELEIK